LSLLITCTTEFVFTASPSINNSFAFVKLLKDEVPIPTFPAKVAFPEVWSRVTASTTPS